MDIIQDANLNYKIVSNFSDNYNEILERRFTREINALNEYMGEEFSTLPMPTLQQLLNKISLREQNYQTTNREMFLNKKQELQNLIDTEQYAKENTPEYVYNINYNNKLNYFVWPDTNELLMRQQEESELLALLG